MRQCSHLVMVGTAPYSTVLETVLYRVVLHCVLQGVALVLGSSLQITPANEIPLSTPDNGGDLVIVNLQVRGAMGSWMVG